MTLQITGLDPSMTGSGVATIWFPPRPYHGESNFEVTLRTFQTKPLDSKWGSRNQRLNNIVDNLTSDIQPKTLVAMEGPAYGAKGQAVWDLTGLWWKLYDRLVEIECEPLIIGPGQRRMYATGSGNASKDVVMLETARRYPDCQVRNNDEADALIFAAMLYHLDQGEPLVPLPKSYTRALDKLRPDFEHLSRMVIR